MQFVEPQAQPVAMHFGKEDAAEMDFTVASPPMIASALDPEPRSWLPSISTLAG